MFVLANLDENKLMAIRRFEAESGLCVVAMQDVDLDPAPVAADTLSDLQELEKDLGVCLVAVK